MADGMIVVEVAAGRAVIAQGRTWLGGQQVWLPANDVASMERQGIVVAIGTYVPPVFTA